MSFASLPAELQFLIISQCLRDASEDTSSLACFPLQCGDCDLATGLALAQVSRSCHAIITSLLYTHIRVTTPSALRQLHSTLNSRPDLAEQVRSIHLGPDSELPLSGWPLSVADEEAEWPDILLETSLSDRDEEEGRLPLWCKPRAAFSLEHPNKTCRGNAINQAMEVALEELNVELWRRGYTREGERCGVRSWASHIFRLQAILDLVLLEMRRHEDAHHYRVTPWRSAGLARRTAPPPEQCREGSCSHYPWFAMLGYHSRKDTLPPSFSNPKDDDMFWIFGWQIWQQLVRPGGPGDHFDHLIHFTRSTRKTLDMTCEEWDSVKDKLGGPHSSLFGEEDWLEAMGTAEELQAYYDKESGYYEDGDASDAVSDASSNSFEWRYDDLDDDADKAEDLIQLGHDVLAQLSGLTNLSVTSYLHRSLTGLKAPERLLKLNIGPRSLFWDNVFPAGVASRLVRLTDLRICGMMSREDADKIAWAMPKLDTVVWEVTEQKGPSVLCKIIESLQAPQERAPKATAVKRPRGKSKNERLEKRQQLHQQQPSNRYTEVQLHPKDAAWAVPKSSAPKANRYWVDGQLAPGTLHPVHVIRRPRFSCKGSDGRRWKVEGELLAEQYDEARVWWEEGTVGGQGDDS